MNNFFKRIVTAVLAAAVVFTATAVPAQAMTKKQVNKEIISLKKKIKKDKKAYPSQLDKDNQLLATYNEIYGSITSQDPFVLYDNKSGQSLYFKDPDGLKINLNTASGLVSISKQFYRFNATDYLVAKVVETPHTASDTKARIESNQARLKLLQNSKKELLAIDGVTLAKGESAQLVTHFSYNTQEINTLKWKSSNTKIVSVSKNGVVTGKKKGSAVISAKLSVTGKTYKTVVNVK